MKFWKIVRFEIACQLRSIATWCFLAALLLFTVFMNVVTTPGDGVYANATFYITLMIIIGTFIWLIMGGAIAGEAGARDVHTRMHPLTYTAPVTKLSYLGGKFIAAFIVNTTLVLSVPLGVLVAFYLPGVEQHEMGPFIPAAYIQTFLLIALPNTFVATSLQFMFASLSRNAMASYFASLLLTISAQLIGMTATNLFGNWELVKLLDPIGLVSLVGGDLETWTPAQKNTRILSLDGMLLWNRVLWVSLAILGLLLTYSRFSLTHPESTGWWNRFTRKSRKQLSKPDALIIRTATPLQTLRTNRTFNFATSCKQTLAIGMTSFRKTIRNPLGLFPLLIIVLLSVVFGYVILTQFRIPLLPKTSEVLNYLAAPVANIKTPWVIIPLLIIYFSGELVWSERDSRIHDVADTLPVAGWVLLAGKYLGLSFTIIAWMTILMVGGILMQASLGYEQFEVALYARVLFGIQLIDYMLFALLAMIVHVIVNQKYLGYLAILFILIFMTFHSRFQVEHKLLIVGADPGWWYTDMRGFGGSYWPWLCFKLYWIGWAILLTAVARLLWVRGREQSLRDRVGSIRSGFTGATVWVTAGASSIVLIIGSYIFYNTNILNEYMTRTAALEKQALYELRYRQYRNIPQPIVTSTKLNVNLYPDKHQADIQATYTLTNTDTIPMDSIHLGSVSGIELSHVTFSRAATNVLNDQELSHLIYVLKEPLQPGDSMRVDFSVAYHPQGFTNTGRDALIVPGGTYFTNFDLLPSVGYQWYRELKDPVTRKKFNLPKQSAIPSLYDPAARQKAMMTDQNFLEVIIGTAQSEVAVAPGALQRTWKENNRSYFHFKTDHPIRGEYAVLSGAYAVSHETWNDVNLDVYYHPSHSTNMDRIVNSAKASLNYYSSQFGPYPYSHLTIVERAGQGGSLSSEASMIDYGEQFALMNPDDSPEGFDLPYYIIAHEVAHQWFGGATLTPANVEGAGVLIEGLAVYSGMQVLEKTYGNHHLQQYINFLHSFYEIPRSHATPPLLQANESFLYYRKGGLAMHAVRRYVGKDSVNVALRRLLDKHRTGKLATTLDLYAELQRVTPDTLHYVLHDLFQENTYWRLKMKQAVALQTDKENWQVTVTVQAQKIIVDLEGNEKEVAMDDWLEVGLYGNETSMKDPLHLNLYRIRSGEQTLIVNLKQKPVRAGIDPNSLMIDLRTDDNMVRVSSN